MITASSWAAPSPGLPPRSVYDGSHWGPSASYALWYETILAPGRARSGRRIVATVTVGCPSSPVVRYSTCSAVARKLAVTERSFSTVPGSTWVKGEGGG